jgi:ABC-type Fe3+-siderophore transport system permease subunit
MRSDGPQAGGGQVAMRRPDAAAAFALGRFGALLLGGIVVLIIGILLDTRFGIVDMSLGAVARALLVDDGSQSRIIVWELRFPRALVAALVGASLAIAGTVMQSLTRNPLASPSLTGVSAGAGLAVVSSLVIDPGRPLWLTPFIAFAGGGVGGAVVFSLATRSVVTPIRLALAGFATAVLLQSLTTGLLILNGSVVGQVYFWLAGGVAGRSWQHVEVILPWFLVGATLALLYSRQLNILLLGEDMARGLGLSTGRTRAALMIIAIVLAASAVAVAGPIGFVGLISPHVARFLIGVDHRRVIPLAAVFGGALVVWADLAARNVQRPLEIPVGILIAMLGGPFFLFLARRNV